MQPKIRVVEKRVKRKNGLVAVYLIEYRNLGLVRYEDSGGHVLDHKRSETANLLPTLEVVELVDEFLEYVIPQEVKEKVGPSGSNSHI